LRCFANDATSNETFLDVPEGDWSLSIVARLRLPLGFPGPLLSGCQVVHIAAGRPTASSFRLANGVRLPSCPSPGRVAAAP